MAVRQIKSEGRCKLCKSDHRVEIDALLELRSEAGKLEDGTRATLITITPLIEAFGVENLTKENVTAHWKRHCQVVSEDAQTEIDKAVQTTIEILNSGDGAVADVDHSLRRLFTIGMAEMEAKIANGQMSGIGPDLLVKISDAITRRKSSDAQSQLMAGLGSAIAGAITGGRVRAIGSAEPDVIDGDYEEVPA